MDNQNYLNDSKVDAVAKTLQAGWEVNQFLFLSMQLMHGNLRKLNVYPHILQGWIWNVAITILMPLTNQS